MKRINYYLFSSLISILIISESIGQQWDWVNTITAKTQSSWMEVIYTDNFNNVFARVPYSGAIYVGDTSFNFATIGSTYNYAIPRYNNQGNFLYALNILRVQQPEMFIDPNQNMYFAGSFYGVMGFCDTIIYSYPNSASTKREVFLCKVNPDNNLVWTGILGNNGEDKFIGICAAPGNDAFYMAGYHDSYISPGVLNYFNQDLSLPFSYEMNTLVKMDTSCSIQWIKEIRGEYGGGECKKLFVGNDNALYLYGRGYSDLYIDEDTIYYPNTPSSYVNSKYWLLKFDHDGTFIHGSYFDWNIWLNDMVIDLVGDIYISGNIIDTVIFGQDTIVVPEGMSTPIIGKFNTDLEPDWYNLFEVQQNQDISIEDLILDQDQLLFAGEANGDIQFGDSVVNFGGLNRELILGEYNQDGEILFLTKTECNKEFYFTNMVLDNCNNLFVSGMFMGNVFFDSISLSSYSTGARDGFVAKLLRTEPEHINLGNDTIACNSFTLQAPLGYQHYIWDDVPGTESWKEVSTSGTHSVFCGVGDGCFHYDEVEVTIDKAEGVKLGPDRTISEEDTLILKLKTEYDWFIWSDGTYNNKITVIASEYGVGNHTIWVEGTKGVCVHYDTLILEIESQFGVDENVARELEISPNPFNDSFILQNRIEYKRASIFDLTGNCIIQRKLDNKNEADVYFEMPDSPKGIYLIKVYTDGGMISTKIIKK